MRRKRAERWMALAALIVAALTVAVLADSPGDHYPGGSTPRPVVYRTLTIYGNVETNDFLVSMDTTGARWRGTNLLDAVQGWAAAPLTTSGALWRAEWQAGDTNEAALRAAADAAVAAAVTGYSNHVRQVYLRGVEAEPGVWTLHIGD